MMYVARGPHCWACSRDSNAALMAALDEMTFTYVDMTKPCRFELFRVSDDFQLNEANGEITASMIEDAWTLTYDIPPKLITRFKDALDDILETEKDL